MVNLFYEEVEILDLNPEFFVSWLSKVCETEKHVLGELNIIFCNDEYLIKLNREHLNHDFYTDIISFDYSSESIIGDLFISIDRVRENAKEQNVEFKSELNRVIVHGLLHLFGYNDKSEKETAEMRSLEDNYLNLIVPRET